MRMLFETTIPTIMTTPISDMTLRVVPVTSRNSNTPGQPGRHGQQDNQGIEEGCELSHQNQIDEHNRKSRPMPKLLNEEFMLCTDPRKLTLTPSGNFVLATIRLI